MIKKFLLSAVAGLSMVLIPASSAFAWTYYLTGSGECQPDGSFQISWRVSNVSESKALVVTASNRDAVPVGSSVPAHEYKYFTETVDGSQAGSFSLTLKANWPGGDSTEHSRTDTEYLRVACPQPPTMTVHKTTDPTGDKTAFMVTASTEDGAIYGDATQSIMGGGTVVYKVKAGGTYTVTEANVDGWTMTSNTCKDLVVGETQEYSILSHDENTQPVNVDCEIVNTKNATPPTGQGGGQVLAATTQVKAPVGPVNGGSGAASKTANLAAFLGLTGSISALGYGIRRLVKS